MYPLMIGATMIAFFVIGPPLLMLYASINERKRKKAQEAKND